MHKVKFIVRHVSNGELQGGYVRELELPFVPTIGMGFKQGASTWLWETGEGELAPTVEAVVYDLDDDVFACLFTVDKELVASFWTSFGSARFTSAHAEMDYFIPRN
jgi:hypothetical protein